PRDPATEWVLGLHAAPRRRRATARAMLRFGEPESWLDVGTGHARFPETARELFPYTAFDGTDLTARVERARGLGRVEEAHVGPLTHPRIRARLAGRYDVVSVLHHLEHTTDPRAELHAALDAVRPGGHLLVETLDPGCLFAALFGRWWLPHDQPRRLHLLPPRNLRAVLEERGCVIVAAGRRAAHVPHDLAGATALAPSHALPAPDTPRRAAPPAPVHRHPLPAPPTPGPPLGAAGPPTCRATGRVPPPWPPPTPCPPRPPPGAPSRPPRSTGTCAPRCFARGRRWWRARWWPTSRSPRCCGTPRSPTVTGS